MWVGCRRRHAPPSPLAQAAGLFIIGAFLSAERYPAYPLAVCIGLFPFVAFVGKRLLFDASREAAKRGEEGRLSNEQALSLIALIFAAIAVSSFFAWIGWLANNGFWGYDEKARATPSRATRPCRVGPAPGATV